MNRTTQGWIFGFLGMLVFSGSLPATRLAMAGFDPIFLTVARAVLAGAMAAAILLLTRQAWPGRREVSSLLLVSLGTVVGFPLLTALALQYITAAHSVIFIGLLPLSTAIFGVLRGGERLRPVFWLFSGLGSALICGYALRNGVNGALAGDLLMLCAIVVCGLGYAEGATLSRKMGGWQVICWALVAALPVMLVLLFLTMPASFASIDAASWWSLAYVAIFSSIVGFLLWYRGLALGGIGAVGQLQLLQPFFGMMLAAVILSENVDQAMVLVTMAVIACVFGAKRFARPVARQG
ncbi:DMT family transporter [Thalassospira sp. TSL5-1]|uniref:DMT family transporter n=1 Tax=Thalassospira sp. TSL5-1 TaxID=1544451 RepID=UPI000938B2F5|nr:DMT family transporter [Thalassospira sp. TSL5-1]OKH89607.1 transporter [Thalassospira sp. TSL5-1]